MAGKIERFENDYAGWGKILTGAAVGALISSKVAQVVAKAGPGHKSQVYVGRDRWRGMVWAATAEARRAEAKDRVLTRALGSARG